MFFLFNTITGTKNMLIEKNNAKMPKLWRVFCNLITNKFVYLFCE